jgi:hypothetical protein
MAAATDQVCPQCGTPLETPQKDSADKLFRTIGTLFGAIILIAIVVNVIAANTGYQGTVKKMVKYFQNDQTKKLVGLASNLEEEIYEAWGEDFDDYCEDKISSKRDSIEDEVGTIKKITYKINSAVAADKDELDEIEEYLDELYIKSSIKKAYTVSLTLTVKGSKDTKDYYTSILVIKENGKWKLASDL